MWLGVDATNPKAPIFESSYISMLVGEGHPRLAGVIGPEKAHGDDSSSFLESGELVRLAASTSKAIISDLDVNQKVVGSNPNRGATYSCSNSLCPLFNTHLAFERAVFRNLRVQARFGSLCRRFHRRKG